VMVVREGRVAFLDVLRFGGGGGGGWRGVVQVAVVCASGGGGGAGGLGDGEVCAALRCLLRTLL
jgi:hypothetical protein